MSRETSPYVVGDYWLDKRRDGKSPDIWQIATYAEKSRSVVYRSTKRRSLGDAKARIHAYVAEQLAKQPQQVEDAEVLPQIMLYWQEHGRDASRPDVIAGSIRSFIGFLAQDEATPHATVAQMTPALFTRFRKWRMGAHSYSVPWKGKEYPVTSPGIRGESVQRALDDIRAALNHAASNGRIPYAPKVPSVPTTMRSPARDVRVTLDDLGAMVGFAAPMIDKETGADLNLGFRRWLLLMIATACRPEAGLAFQPSQASGELIDLNPKDRPRTKKRNPVIPLIEPFKAVLADWRASPTPLVRSRRTAWRTMRRALDLPAAVIPKTIRHTIATELRSMGVPGEQISGLLGHVAMSRITEVYAKYDPAYLAETKKALTIIFEEVMRRSETWAADHRRTKEGNGPVKVIAAIAE